MVRNFFLTVQNAWTSRKLHCLSIQKGLDLLIPFLVQLFRSSHDLSHIPSSWAKVRVTFISIAGRKSTEQPNFYWLISLWLRWQHFYESDFNTVGKWSSYHRQKCIYLQIRKQNTDNFGRKTLLLYVLLYIIIVCRAKPGHRFFISEIFSRDTLAHALNYSIELWQQWYFIYFEHKSICMYILYFIQL